MSTTPSIFGAIDDALLDDDFLAGPDEFGELGSPSLEAEINYGAISGPSAMTEYDDDFGFDDDDDDDDDEYGGDYEWFGAEEDDDIDEGFEDLEAEIDAEFGAWYGYDAGSLAPAEGILSDDRDLIAHSISSGAMLPASFQDGKLEGILTWMRKTLTGNEGREIANYLTHQPGFGEGPVTAEMVEAAVKEAAMPGMEAAWDEPLKELWYSEEPSWTAWLSGVPGAAAESVKEYFMTDIPTAIKGFLGESGIPVSDDQVVNSMAIGIWLMSWNPLVGDEIYKWIANDINSEVPHAVQRDVQAEMPTRPMPGMSAPIDIAPPLPAGAMPRPQTILAFGYGLMSAAAALGLS